MTFLLFSGRQKDIKKHSKTPCIKLSFLSFCLFVLLFFRLAITVIECLKGLKSQKSRIVSKFECGSQSISDLKGRYRAAGAAKNLGERFGTHPAI